MPGIVSRESQSAPGSWKGSAEKAVRDSRRKIRRELSGGQTIWIGRSEKQAGFSAMFDTSQSVKYHQRVGKPSPAAGFYGAR